MFDLQKFFELKDLGKATATKLNGNDFNITTKKYDPNTGVELPSEVIEHHFSELSDKKDDNIIENTLIDDFNALFEE